MNTGSTNQNQTLDHDHITIAVPNKGRLNKPALELLANAGLHIIDESSRKLFARCTNQAVSILFARASDIPEYVAMGAADLGMTGYDLICEKEANVEILMDLSLSLIHISEPTRLGMISYA